MEGGKGTVRGKEGKGTGGRVRKGQVEGRGKEGREGTPQIFTLIDAYDSDS